MATDVLMPQLGESITEGTILRWVKGVGDRVDRDEPLFEISTDKVDVEIASPTAGVLLEIRVAEGETVPIDSVVAIIGEEGEVPGETAGAEPQASAAPTRSAAPPAAPKDDTPRTPRLSPVVRRIACEQGVDVTQIRGTGAAGRVTKADVLSHVERRSASGGRSEPMSIIRRKIAEHMVRSRRTSAHTHTVFDVDFTHAEALRQQHRHRYEETEVGAKLTYLVFVAKAVVDAVPAVPVVNASLDGDTIVYRDDVNLGIAVALDGGLIVPVIKGAQKTSVVELSRAIVDLVARARAKRLTPDDVEGGTFTLTNAGSFGSVLGMPIINQPQVAILGMGAVEQRPVVIDDAVSVRLRAYLTLGFDHRVIDGAVADRFMATVKRHIEQFDETLL